jgi:hypothetical protein
MAVGGYFEETKFDNLFLGPETKKKSHSSCFSMK